MVANFGLAGLQHPWLAGGILLPDTRIVKEYDLVYSNQGGDWNDFARNWTLAKASMVNLIKELDFKVSPQI